LFGNLIFLRSFANIVFSFKRWKSRLFFFWILCQFFFLNINRVVDEEYLENICFQKDENGASASEKLIKDRFKEDTGRDMSFEEKKAMRKTLVKREREQSFKFLFMDFFYFFFKRNSS
jgi:hypothetical protein